MSFTATSIGNSARPEPPAKVEDVHYVNTAGSSGGTITAKFLDRVTRVRGNYLSATVSGKTATIVTDVNAVGEVELVDDPNQP